MKKYFLMMAVVLLLSVSASAEWISFGGQSGDPPQIALLQDGPEGTTIEFTIVGFFLDTLDIGGDPYSVISLPKTTTFLEKGWPKLPKMNQSIIVEDDAHVSYEIVES